MEKEQMNHLIDKYRKDELSIEELSELKKRTAVMTDEEIEQQLRTNWLNDETDTSFIDDDIERRMKRNIDAQIKRHSQISWPTRWSRIAATILLPLSILCTVYFYRESHRVFSQEIVVSTAKAERASITLPDGTLVSLNAESTLEYHPKDYNTKERKINFSGEGYFQVFRNEKVPFFINAKGLQVKVLGTVFNLSVREKDATAVLSLEEGSVSLLSTQNHQQAVLQEHQKAILNHLTGEITIVADAYIGDLSAWRRGDMVFRNTEPARVIRDMEESYNRIIQIDCKDCLSDPFTGTLPVNDLNEALEVLEHTYHIRLSSTEKKLL
jgi:ferric-dicitrate binding protein FerR (iron transport regulator)